MKPQLGGDVDDAAFRGLEPGQSGFHCKKARAQHDIEMQIPMSIIGLLDRALDIDGGIVDEEVEPPEAPDRLLDRRTGAVGQGKIGGHRRQALAAAELGDGGVGGFGGAVIDRDLGARLMQGPGDGEPEPASGTGDERCFAGIVDGHGLILDNG
jgi:hypothetical protein